MGGRDVSIAGSEAITEAVVTLGAGTDSLPSCAELLPTSWWFVIISVAGGARGAEGAEGTGSAIGSTGSGGAEPAEGSDGPEFAEGSDGAGCTGDGAGWGSVDGVGTGVDSGGGALASCEACSVDGGGWLDTGAGAFTSAGGFAASPVLVSTGSAISNRRVLQAIRWFDQSV